MSGFLFEQLPHSPVYRQRGGGGESHPSNTRYACPDSSCGSYICLHDGNAIGKLVLQFVSVVISPLTGAQFGPLSPQKSMDLLLVPSSLEDDADISLPRTSGRNRPARLFCLHLIPVTHVSAREDGN